MSAMQRCAIAIFVSSHLFNTSLLDLSELAMRTRGVNMRDDVVLSLCEEPFVARENSFFSESEIHAPESMLAVSGLATSGAYAWSHQALAQGVAKRNASLVGRAHAEARSTHKLCV